MTGHRPSRGGHRRAGFTLLEVILATAASAIIFAAIFGVFSRAIHLRNEAAHRSRQTQLRARALTVLRDDLRGGFLSGGILAVTLTGSRTAAQSRFPGYLRLTTTTGSINTGNSTQPGQSSGDLPSGDVQEVEYYVAADPDSEPNAGTLVRVIDQDLLSAVPQAGKQESLLTGVSGMEVYFFDGQNWTDSWDSSSTSSTSATSTSTTDPTVTNTAVSFPQAIRVRITQVATDQGATPPPLEVLVPWIMRASIPAPPAAATTTTP